MCFRSDVWHSGGNKNKRLTFARGFFIYKTSRPRNPSMDFVFGAAILEIKREKFLPRPGGGFHGSLDSLLSFSLHVLRVYRLSRSFAYATRTDWGRGGEMGIVSQWDSCQIQTIYMKKKVTGPDKERSLGCCGCDERPWVGNSSR